MNANSPMEINVNPINENSYEFNIIMFRTIYTKEELLHILKALKTVEGYILPEMGLGVRSQS
jgi:hypothetical protein